MKKFRWVCETCNATGEVLIQFSQSTPIDIEQADIQRARCLAPQIVKHEHPITILD